VTAASIYVLNSKGTVREKMFLKNIHGKKKVEKSHISSL
jgi:hypothetical protein